MTYCVGLKLNDGLVFMSDTRTNAGVDNISVFSKMSSWSADDRHIVLLSAGNLATTQAVISLLDERIKQDDENTPSLMTTNSMFRTACLIGETVREVISDSDTTGQNAETFGATLILGGQIKGEKPRLYCIYPEGNFIESSDDTPFFQIGEHKYGKPIIVRAYNANMDFEDAIKLLLVSFDSTIRANLSVGLPLDVQIYKNDSYEAAMTARFERHDPYYQSISEGWSKALIDGLEKLPRYEISDK